MQLLLIVEDHFEIQGNLAITPGIDDLPEIRHGAIVSLKRPDDSVIDAVVDSIGIPTPNWYKKHPIWLKGLTKEDVPIGTEIWADIKSIPQAK